MSLSVLLFPASETILRRHLTGACLPRRQHVETVILPEQVSPIAELLHHTADHHQLVAYASFVQKSLDDTEPEQRQRLVVAAVRGVLSADTFIVMLDARSNPSDCDIFWESYQVLSPYC